MVLRRQKVCIAVITDVCTIFPHGSINSINFNQYYPVYIDTSLGHGTKHKVSLCHELFNAGIYSQAIGVLIDLHKQQKIQVPIKKFRSTLKTNKKLKIN